MNTMKPTKPVILTGVRANNDIHIGNYFGAILPIVDMAKPIMISICSFRIYTALPRQLTTASCMTVS